MTCPGSARRIGPQSPRQHGAAAAPALALTPACVGHQLSLPRVWDTSSHSRVCGTPAVTPMCAGHQLSLARVWDTSSHSSVCGTPALTPACVGHQLSLPHVWDTSSHSCVCGTPALTPACVEHQLSLPCVWNTSCGRRCQILSMLLASHEHLLGQVQEAPGG